ncbi:unnamed protein product, partial [Closterium sp. NIES-54]
AGSLGPPPAALLVPRFPRPVAPLGPSHPLGPSRHPTAPSPLACRPVGPLTPGPSPLACRPLARRPRPVVLGPSPPASRPSPPSPAPLRPVDPWPVAPSPSTPRPVDRRHLARRPVGPSTPGRSPLARRPPARPSAPPLGPLITAATAATATTATAAPATAAPEYYATMASLRVLVFDHEGRLVAFDTWHDELQLYLLSNIKDSVSLFDHVSGVAPAPPATADGSTRFQWLSRDATARLAIRNHLPVAECTHFGQHRTAQALYDAVVARYSSPATATLGRWLLPYLFPKLSAFATVADMVTHLRTSDAPQTCGKFHTDHRCFSHLDDAWRAEFGDDVERPCWTDLLRSGVAIFDLDYDAIISTMYALSFSAEGDCYRCVPPDPGIAADAIGACASGTPRGTAPAEALHTFTLDSGASRCFFRESTTLTPLPAPVPLRLADPSRGLVVASSSTVLPCPAVSASGQVAASCLCRLLSHQTLLWHQRLGHPSLPRLRGMHSWFLVSGLPRSLPPLSPSPAPPCLPCVEGRQRAAPHSSSFPPTTTPLQTLHMDVWGPARISGQGRERYFLLVVDDYTRYTTVFRLRNKGQVVDVLIPWIRTVRLQLRKRFGTDLPVLRLHSDRGGEFSSDLLREGILQSFTLLASPQQNGIAERRIGLVMEVARNSMIHAAAPHILWLFAVRYAAHQINLWPRVSLPETSPTLRWTGKVGDASMFRFYHPTSRRVLSSQDVTFEESVPFYRLFPYRSAPPPPPPLFLAPGLPPVDPLLPQGHAPSSAAPGASSGGAESGGAEPGGGGSEGAGYGGAEPGGAEPEGVEPGVLSRRVRSLGVLSLGVLPRLESGAPGAGGAGDTGAGGDAVKTGAGGTGGSTATCPGGARTSGVGCAGAGDPTEPGAAGSGGAGARGAGVGGPGARGAGVVDPGTRGTVRQQPYFVPLLQQSGGLTERREPASRPVSPVRTARLAPRLRPPPVPGTHVMALRPSSVPLLVPLPTPPESSLPEIPDP